MLEIAPTPGGGALAARSTGGDEEGTGLHTVIRRLAQARSRQEIMAAVSQGARNLLHADGATFVLREGDRCYYAEEDAISPLWKGRLFPMSACISGWCMANNRSVAIPDIYQDPRVATDAYRPTFVRSLAMAPVRLDQPIAAIGAYWSEPHQARPEELQCLQAIADAAALATASLRLQQAESSGPSAPAKPIAPPAGEPELNPAPAPRSLRGFIDRVRNQGLRPDTLEAYAFAVLCVATATLLRFLVAVSGVHGVVPFSLYYPAAALARLAGGRGPGVLAAVLGGLAAYSFFMPPLFQFSQLAASDVIDLVLYAVACGLTLLIIDVYKRALRRLRQEDAMHLTFAREQRHRLRNAAAVVDAIVKLSLKEEPEKAATINRRIRAGLAEIDMQDQSAEKPARLRDLLACELQPYDLSRFSLEGADETTLPAKARCLVSLAAHELSTNALKYGALSVPDGRVAVSWRAVDDGRLAISWRESGGPVVQPPKRRGYGSIMLTRLVEAAGGALALAFPPAGATAEITLPLRPAG